jgi:GNAT superfamily N-acetyltransferase
VGRTGSAGFHVRSFNPGRWQIITVSGTDIGMIDVEHQPTEIYLARIEVHPSYQGRGVGARLISALIDEATHNGQDLVLDVLTVNHRAQALYQRLGMKRSSPARQQRHQDHHAVLTAAPVRRSQHLIHKY